MIFFSIGQITPGDIGSSYTSTIETYVYFTLLYFTSGEEKLSPVTRGSQYSNRSVDRSTTLFMAALCNRADHNIFIL